MRKIDTFRLRLWCSHRGIDLTEFGFNDSVLLRYEDSLLDRLFEGFPKIFAYTEVENVFFDELYEKS